MAAVSESGFHVVPEGKKLAPWCVGQIVTTAPKTTAEAIALAGLDWRVIESPLQSITSQGPRAVPGWKSLTRSDTGEVLQLCRDSWTPVQNDQAFAWFDPIIADGDAMIESAVSLKGGRRLAITARIPGETSEVVKSDPVDPYIVLFNSHDGTLALGLTYTNIRVVCHNTLNEVVSKVRSQRLGDGEMVWSGKHAQIRHTKSIHDNMSAIRDLMQIRRREFRHTMEQYKAMAKIDLSPQAFDKYLTKVFAPPTSKDGQKTVKDLRYYPQILENFEGGTGADLPGARGTLWGAYNAITEWTSHQRSKGDNEIEAARKRLNSIWFGQGAAINQAAHNAALEMTRV